MAVVDHRISSGQGRRRGGGGGGVTLMKKLQEHVPNSTQLMGILALVISGAILLLLTGLTVTATVLGLTLIMPLIVLTSPIWVPVGVALLMGVGGLLSMCGFGVTVVAGLTWVYRYIRGRHPPGSQRIDYARSRLADTASHVKDYAWDYSGFLSTRVKDAAPGA